MSDIACDRSAPPLRVRKDKSGAQGKGLRVDEAPEGRKENGIDGIRDM